MAFTAAAFNKFLSEHKLCGTRCTACETLHLPPRPICPACLSDKIEWVELSGRGTLNAFTVVHIMPPDMIAAGYDRKHPYCVGIVQLDEGPSISAQILGLEETPPEQIAIGTSLHADFIERGEGEKRRTYLAFKI